MIITVTLRTAILMTILLAIMKISIKVLIMVLLQVKVSIIIAIAMKVGIKMIITIAMKVGIKIIIWNALIPTMQAILQSNCSTKSAYHDSSRKLPLVFRLGKSIVTWRKMTDTRIQMNSVTLGAWLG